MCTPPTKCAPVNLILGLRASALFVPMVFLGLFGPEGLAADPAHVDHVAAAVSSDDLHTVTADHESCPMMDRGANGRDKSLKQRFPLGAKGLPKASRTETISLNSGDVIEMELAPVKKKIGGRWLRMLAYNGSVPGPTLRVRQGGKITLRLRNRGDTETSLHTHGVRLPNAFDGVPGLTQKTQRIGETLEYRLEFPDPGVYWYHPHVRTDYALASGLYGAVVVTPTDTSYWPPVNREIVLALADIALDPSGDRIPFFKEFVDHALMGRFGNSLLTNGDTDHRFAVKRGEVVRLYLTNVANARVFNLAIPGVRMKQVGADLGRYPKETWVDSVVLAPGERRVVDVLFDRPGHYPLQHRTPNKTHSLGSVTVNQQTISRSYAKAFSLLRTEGRDAGNNAALEPFFSIEPQKYLKLTLDMDHSLMEASTIGEHGLHRMPDGTLMNHAAMGEKESGDGIEWEDTMATMNRAATSKTVVWKMVDEITGKENMAIETWNFTQGDKIKIRLFNDPNGMHPMYHPIHFHGQRFLVLATNGVRNTNPAWQDTTLIPQGATVDILLDASNPGKWMAHCHIVEHAESGMMLPFQVK